MKQVNQTSPVIELLNNLQIFISALLISCTFARPADDDKIDDLDDWDVEDAVDEPKESANSETSTAAAEPQGPVSHIQKIPPRNAKPTVVPTEVTTPEVSRKRRDTEIRHVKRDAKTKRNKKQKDLIPEEMSGESAVEKSSPKPKRSRKGGKGKKKPTANSDLENPEQEGEVNEGDESTKPKQKPKKQRKPKKPKQAKHRRGGKNNRRSKTTSTTEPSLSEPAA